MFEAYVEHLVRIGGAQVNVQKLIRLSDGDAVDLFKNVLAYGGGVLLQEIGKFEHGLLPKDEKSGRLGPHDGIYDVFNTVDARDGGDAGVAPARVEAVQTIIFGHFRLGTKIINHD